MSYVTKLLSVAAICVGPFARADAADSIPVAAVQVTVLEEADLAIPVAGRLMEVAAKEGVTVAEGDVLARLDDREAQLQLKRAEIELRIAEQKAENDVSVRFAEKAMMVAIAELKRGQAAYEQFKQSISDSELERLRLTVEKWELDVEQAKRDLKVAKLDLELKRNLVEQADLELDHRQIRAPFAGEIVKVAGFRGEWVESGESLIHLVRVDRLRVEGFVAANQSLAELKRATATIEIPDEAGRTRTLSNLSFHASPEISPVNGQRRIWLEVDNRQARLSPGMKISMSVTWSDNKSAASNRSAPLR